MKRLRTIGLSLALGLGQYASKQHRPIESVIIDEGFGCLDRQDVDRPRGTERHFAGA